MDGAPPSPGEPVEVRLLSVLPTPAGFAVFMERGPKIATIYIDPSIGLVLPSLKDGYDNLRPLTHHLIRDMMSGFGIRLRNACITSVRDGVFHARLVMEMTNQVSDRQIAELDVRSSDAMALCLMQDIPLQMAAEVWGGLADVTGHYRALAADCETNNMLHLGGV